MTKEQRERLEAALENDMESVEAELKAFEEELKPIAPDCSLGDLLRAEMMHDQEVLNGAYVEAKKRYNRLKYAKSHLNDVDYGLCVDCDEAIAYERLLLMPESQYCVRCAKERGL